MSGVPTLTTMKFTTSASVLAEALTIAKQAMVKTPSLVAYTGVHLVVKSGQLTVTGSDGDTTITATVPVTAATSGSVLLPPGPISKFLGTVDADARLTVTTDGQYEVVVTAAGASPYRFRSLAETFPTPAPLKADRVDVDFRRLAPALAAVTASAGKEKLCQLVSAEHGLHVHTTDQYRLTRAALPEAGFGPFSGLLRLPVLEQVARSHVNAVQVDPRGRVICAYGDGVTIMTRLVDERFHAVGTILDAPPPYTTRVPSAALRRALSRLESVTETARPLTVQLSGTEMVLSMDSVNLGSGQERVELAEPMTTSLTFGVNLEYLSQAVASLAAADITVRWSEPERPIFLCSSEPIPATTVVMPVKM